MKILVVASYNKGSFASFVAEQAEALRQAGCCVEMFGIVGKGVGGYLREFPRLMRYIRTFQPDIVHAHYGLSGLLACMQRKVPVVVTFHGSDVHDPHVLRLSQIAMHLSAQNIVVSPIMLQYAGHPAVVLPCGINLPPSEQVLGLQEWTQTVFRSGEKHVLFAGSFSNDVKDAPLAKQTIAHVQHAQLIELKGYTRNQVYALMYASDALLLTSKWEGSPQVVKEAMACGLPIVAIDVGDIKRLTCDIDGCYISPQRDPAVLAELLVQAVSHGSTSGRERILKEGLTNDVVAQSLLQIYNQILIK